MAGGDMDLLDERRRIRRSMEAQIAECRHLAPGSSGKSHYRYALLTGGADGLEDVRRPPGSGNHDQHVAGTAEPENLPLEHPVVAIIVANCGQNRAVGRQRSEERRVGKEWRAGG